MQITWRNGTMEGRFCDKLLQAARKPLILNGEMSEWLKEHAWKACVGETLPWVRIPLSPPTFAKTLASLAGFGWQAASSSPMRRLSLEAVSEANAWRKGTVTVFLSHVQPSPKRSLRSLASSSANARYARSFIL